MDELRRTYHDRIAGLRDETSRMLDDTKAAVERVTAAIIARHPDFAGVGDVDRRVAAVEAEVVDLLAQQGPIASDLRVILASLFIAETGGLCLGLCRTLGEQAGSAAPVLTPAMVVLTRAIGAETAGLLGRAGGAWRVLDAGMACDVIQAASTSRDLQRRFLAELFGLRDVPVDVAVNLGMAARAYARLTDHAVDIAGRVVFAATGAAPPLAP